MTLIQKFCSLLLAFDYDVTQSTVLLDQAITQGGAISANWVLVGVCSGFSLLLWRMLGKIDTNLEKAVAKIGTHETKLQLHDKSIEDLEEEVFNRDKKLSRK